MAFLSLPNNQHDQLFSNAERKHDFFVKLETSPINESQETFRLISVSWLSFEAKGLLKSSLGGLFKDKNLQYP